MVQQSIKHKINTLSVKKTQQKSDRNHQLTAHIYSVTITSYFFFFFTGKVSVTGELWNNFFTVLDQKLTMRWLEGMCIVVGRYTVSLH